MNNNPNQHCYLCGIAVREYKLKPDERHLPDELVPDHVPPKGLFPKPRPNNLIIVPCCFQCNNKHSGFDERLRMVASMPFDRNKAGQKILDEKVVGGTLAKNRQMQFVDELLTSMQSIAERPELVRACPDGQEFKDGMIRITKGLLFALHPSLDYRKSTFDTVYIRQQSSVEQRRLMLQIMRGLYLERGQRVFQCWRHVDEARDGGVWMLVLYGCFGFFVFHTNKPELHRLFSNRPGVSANIGLRDFRRTPLKLTHRRKMKTKQQVDDFLFDRNCIIMFIEEVEQSTAFWLWHKYASKHRQEKTEWDYHFRMFLISTFYSSLLSVRKLNDFFTTEGWPDDIKANRYGFKNMTSPLDSDARKSLNKFLAHMTFTGAKLRFQELNIDDYARPIYLRSFEFCQHLEKNFLDPKMDAEILGKVVSFKRGLLSHIKRIGATKTKVNDC